MTAVPMYALLRNAKAVLLAFENGKTVEHAVDDSFTVLESVPTEDEIESNLARGHTYRALHKHTND